MNTYVLLSKLTPDGARRLRTRPERLREVNEEIEAFGCVVISQFATMGPYDFVTVVQAPDNDTMMRLSAMLGSRGTVELMSMPAVWVTDFLDQLDVDHGQRTGDQL